MPRRAQIQPRTSEPDAVLGSVLVTQLVNRVILDGKKSIGEIAPASSLRPVARVLFEGLWWYDQVVFDRSRARNETAA